LLLLLVVVLQSRRRRRQSSSHQLILIFSIRYGSFFTTRQTPATREPGGLRATPFAAPPFLMRTAITTCAMAAAEWPSPGQGCRTTPPPPPFRGV